MEPSFVVSPNGSQHPATPTNTTAVQTMHQLKSMLSNKKSPLKSMSLNVSNVPKVPQVSQVPQVPQVHVPKDPSSLEPPKEEDIETYRDKMRELERQLRGIEQAMEEKEARHCEELARIQRDLKTETTNQYERQEFDQKERELSLRERELELRQREQSAQAERTESKRGSTDMEHSTLSISDPAGNVVCDLAMCRTLEDNLQNERFSISTVYSLFDTALKRHETLRKTLALVSGGHSCRFVVQKFKNEFGSLYKISRTTMSLISVLAKSSINAVSLSKVKAAIKYSASRTLEELKLAVPIAEKSGIVPAIDSSHKLRRLTELPGIQQLLARSDQPGIEQHWAEIDSFVDAVIFFVGDKKLKLQKAKDDLNAFDGRTYIDCSEVLADYSALSDICLSWFGSETQNDYDRIQGLLVRCPVIVQEQYAKFVSTPIDGVQVNEFTMGWEDFENVLHTVWVSAFTEQQVRVQFGLDVQNIRSPHIRPTDNQRSIVPPSRLPFNGVPGNLVDIAITCVDCTKDFNFSANQQQKHLAAGYENQPKRCPKCKGQVCDIWKAEGKCPFGDDCKFLHGDPPEREKVPIPCRFWSAGTCLKGADCHFVHEGQGTDKEVVHMMQPRPSAGTDEDRFRQMYTEDFFA